MTTLSTLAICHNVAAVLPQYIQSILAQELPPDEMVFVDDGSYDDTLLILNHARDEIEARGIGVTVTTHSERRGRGAARQTAIEVARGIYVTWTDVDDLIRPDRLYTLRQSIEAYQPVQDGAALLVSPFIRIQSSQLFQQKTVGAQTVTNVADLYSTRQATQLQAIFGRRTAFSNTGFDSELNWAEDTDFVIRYLANGGQLIGDEGADPSRILYFQSFLHVPRETVYYANRRMAEKNGRILREAGIDPQAQLQAKRKRYIDKFLKIDEQWLSPVPEEPEGGSVLPDFPEGEVEAFWHDVEGRPLSNNGLEASSIDSACLVPALLMGARSLHWRDVGTGALLASFDLVRRPSGVIALSSSVQRLKPTDVSIANANQDQLDDNCVDQSDENTVSNSDLRVDGQFVSRYARITSACSIDSAIIVSFFSGASYYHNCARRLSEQLDRSGVDYEICELTLPEDSSWIKVCRQKIAFIRHIRKKHRRAIMWMDVDGQLIGDPSWHLSTDSDLGAFLRNFAYFMGFDSQAYARLLHPGYLRFGSRPVVDRFLDHLEVVDAKAPENATDDYVIQEALTSFNEPLAFLCYPPRDIVTSNESLGREWATFQHSDSGNVSMGSKLAVQHVADAISVPRQIRVMRHAASMAIKKGQHENASVFLREIRRLDPDDSDSLSALLKLFLKVNDTGRYGFHKKVGLSNPATRSAVLRVELDRQYQTCKFKEAAATTSELERSDNSADANFAASRRYRHSFDVRAHENHIPDDARVPMMWWEHPHPGNLGDIIGPYIVEAITGIPPRYVSKSPRLLSVGSIIKWARAGDMVWGSGASDLKQTINPDARYHAVRGPLTRGMILDAGADCPEVYGDPAWLLPEIFDARNVTKTHRLGLIRHFSHADRTLEVAPDVLNIDIIRSSREDIERFLTDLNRCEAIVSTSLHGGIIANAYGIPACFATDTASARQIHGDGMKFRDYGLSVGMESLEQYDIGNLDRIDSTFARHCNHIPQRSIDIEALLSASPFSVNPNFLRLRDSRRAVG